MNTSLVQLQECLALHDSTTSRITACCEKELETKDKV